MSETVLRVITILASIFGLVMIAFSVRAMRRERPMSRVRPLVSAGILAVVTIGYLFITRTQVNLWTALALIALGLLIGWGEGRLTRIYYKGNRVVGKQSGFYLILWGLAYVLTLLVAQTNIPALHAGGILAMMLGMGVALASGLTLFMRIGNLRPQPAPTPAWQPTTPR
jgi:hypothetical protein